MVKTNTFKQRILLLLVLQFVCISISDATVYVYVLPDGNKLITDQKQTKPGYTLKRTYPTSTRSRTNYHRSKPVKSEFDELITRVANKYALEPSFIKAVIHVESAFNPNAISGAGAMGLMQLMPDTASLYKMKRDYFDPGKNLDVGVQHLKGLLTQYNQDKTLSLAAYNAGENAVNKYHGVPPYDETRNYVEKVMRLYNLYKLNS